MRKRCIIRAVTSPLIITAIAVAYILILLSCVYCHCSQPVFLSELFDHPIQTFNIYLGNGSLNYHTSDKTPLSALAYIQKGIIQHTSGSQIPEHNTTISPRFISYQNLLYNFIIAYPSNWTKMEFSNVSMGTIVKFVPKASAKFNSETVSLYINISHSAGTPLTDLIAEDIVKLRQNVIDFRLIDSSSGANINCYGECPAYGVTYSYRSGLSNFTVNQLSTLVGDKRYTVEYRVKSDQYYTFLPVLREMIDSFKIEQVQTSASQYYIQNSRVGIGMGSDPYYISINPITTKIYITNLRSGTVSVVNSSTDKVISNVIVGRLPGSLGINKITNTIYVANSGSNTVSLIDGTTDRVIGTPIPVGKNPSAVAVDDQEPELKSLVFVSNQDSNTVSVIDGLSNTFLGSISVGLQPGDLAIDPIVNRLYVANSGLNSVSVIDYYRTEGGEFKYNNVAKIRVGNQPNVLSFNPNTNSLYVANSESDTISIINTTTNKVYKTIPVDSAPYGMDIDRNLNTIYVANYGSNTISVIDGKSLGVTKIKVGAFPYDIVVDQNSHRIYITDLGPNIVSEVNGSSKKLLEGIVFTVHPADGGFIECNGRVVASNVYLRYDNGTECIAKPNTGFIFDSWSNIRPGEGTSNSRQANIILASYGTEAAQFFQPKSFVEKYGNQISAIALIALLIIPTVASTRPSLIKKIPFLNKVSLEKVDNSLIIPVNGAIIAGALILLTLTSANVGGISSSQRTFITANIIFPFAISAIVALVGTEKLVTFRLFEVRLMIAGFINLMISILLLAIIGY